MFQTRWFTWRKGSRLPNLQISLVDIGTVHPKRIEEEYRRGLLCTDKENRRGVQERSSLYSQRESKRQTEEVFFVHPKRIEEEYRTGLLVQPKRIEEKYRRGLLCTVKEN
jgi:hypothetical protein